MSLLLLKGSYRNSSEFSFSGRVCAIKLVNFGTVFKRCNFEIFVVFIHTSNPSSVRLFGPVARPSSVASDRPSVRQSVGSIHRVRPSVTRSGPPIRHSLGSAHPSLARVRSSVCRSILLVRHSPESARPSLARDRTSVTRTGTLVRHSVGSARPSLGRVRPYVGRVRPSNLSVHRVHPSLRYQIRLFFSHSDGCV